MTESRAAQHRFQSFWYGGALSPYEQFCLKSFVDCGHGVDLYTYDPSLVVPEGVRVCDAAELVSRDEVFVSQEYGVGKGSPSPFTNLFRYMLLVEKGGWWVDTDVVCLTDHVPIVEEFFAREGAELVGTATMYFKPRHPIMTQCLDHAIKIGRSVKWGDTGPKLLTSILKEHGLIDRAHPPSICYPVKHDEAVDVLRPSRAAIMARQIEGSLFLHLWNAMLVHHGVTKVWLPPHGSLLRQLVDKHPVKGWAGEYDERILEHILNLKAELNAQTSNIARFQAEEQRLIADVRSCNMQIATLSAYNVGLNKELTAILASTSWRVTAPLRAAVNLVRHLKGS